MDRDDREEAGLNPQKLAQVHGISAQAVRNYEAAGVLPPARRTASGYRVFTEVHAGAPAPQGKELPCAT